MYEIIEICTNFAISPPFANLKDFIYICIIEYNLKTSRPGVFDIRCLSWNTAIIVSVKKCHMDKRRYKSPY